MCKLIAIEIHKNFTNLYVYLSILILLVLSIFSAYVDISRILYGFEQVLDSRGSYVSYSLFSSFGATMVTDFYTLPVMLFYLILPLACAFPFGTSINEEKINGHISQANIRINKKEYIVSKQISTAITAFIIVAVPMLINITICLCFLPSYLPDVESNTAYGVFSFNLFSFVFYNYPILYFFIYNAYWFICCSLGMFYSELEYIHEK